MRQKKREVARKMDALPLEKLRSLVDVGPTRDFYGALLGGDKIIAEVKKRSPRVAEFTQAQHIDGLAAVYERNGACAVSVVTDEIHFGMSLADAQAIRNQVSLPVLVKDFFFDPYQIYEARAFGADAVLLISLILSADRLRSLLAVTHQLGMRALVEIHSRRDLLRATQAGAEIVGINNRDLDTLEVSLDATRNLVGLVGNSALIVSESGIRSRRDIQELCQLGVNAFLVGGALLESSDPGKVLRTLLGKSRATDNCDRVKKSRTV